jgi:hypothetical protein
MTVSKELIKAYEQAKYVVEDHFELRVGEINRKLDDWLDVNGAQLAAFISPENPYSEQLSKKQNGTRHDRFVSELNNGEIDYVEGYGVDDSEEWPREKSYLVLVKNKETADLLANSYGQNAYLYCEKGKAVKLVVCSKG